WANNSLTNQYYDTTIYYKFGDIAEVNKYNSSNTLISKSLNEYYFENIDTGYIGQLYLSKEFDNSNFSLFRATKYLYFKN
ncbi:MAG TPA: hypothetical protein DEP28_05880, partial [Bacteroidetes bacterium]|nr:hypothetical protein [Bacteroidota bacterium]